MTTDPPEKGDVVGVGRNEGEWEVVRTEVVADVLFLHVSPVGHGGRRTRCVDARSTYLVRRKGAPSR